MIYQKLARASLGCFAFLWLLSLGLTTAHSMGAAEKTTSQKGKPSATNYEEGLVKLNRALTQEKQVRSRLEKSTTLKLLGREQQARGEILIHRGRVRLELEAPEKSLLVVNDKEAWVVTYPPEDFPDAPTEAIVTSRKGLGTNLGIASILSGEGLFEVFKVKGVELSGESLVFSLEPRQSTSEFQRAVLATDKNIKKILELTYWDQMENKVTYRFLDMALSDGSPPTSRFEYKPDANVSITRQ